MKKLISTLLAAAVAATAVFSLAACSKDTLTIAVPNDTTNEARALLLLEEQGIIELDDAAGITATIRDITAQHHF